MTYSIRWIEGTSSHVEGNLTSDRVSALSRRIAREGGIITNVQRDEK